MAKKSTIFPDVSEVFLPSAPLVRVLAQVRFEAILAIQSQSTVAPFQEAIRETYPVLRAEKTKTLIDGPDGSKAIDHPPVWRFSDLPEEWRVSLAPDFIALETTKYKSREEFLAKFRVVLSAFTRNLKPGVVTRVGIRYIDRLVGDALATIPKMVRQELVGIVGSEVSADATASQALFNLGEGQLFARWGLLPAETTLDPNVLDAIDRESWILDIDSSNSARRQWDQEVLLAAFEKLAANSYNFFRWAVTDEFLKFHGGSVK